MCVRGVGARLFFEADMWHQGCWSGGDTAAKRRGRAGKDGGEGLAELLRPPVMPIYPPEQGCSNNHSLLHSNIARNGPDPVSFIIDNLFNK